MVVSTMQHHQSMQLQHVSSTYATGSTQAQTGYTGTRVQKISDEEKRSAGKKTSRDEKVAEEVGGRRSPALLVPDA